MAHPFGASIHADFLFVNEWLTHFAPNQTTHVKQTQLPGLGLGADASWLFASDVELVAGAGIEEVFRSTDVDVQGVNVATLSPLSVVAEAGLRVDF